MQTSQLTPQQKYDLLTKDFLERDGDHFVRIRKSGRLGWEDELPKDSAYSAVILNPKSDRELLLNATRLARQMITAMDTPFKVNVKIDATSSKTNGKDLFIATKVLDDTSLPLGKRLDTFLGLAIHEGSHLLYTDFDFMHNAKVSNIVLKDIHNIIEDEMIERRLGESKPGLANFIKASKYYYFGKYDKKDKPQDKLSRLFNAILILIRYPASLDDETIFEFADELLQVREILTDYPENTEQSLAKAKEVFEVLRKYANEQQNNKNNKDNNNNKNNKNSEQNSNTPENDKSSQEQSRDKSSSNNNDSQNQEDKDDQNEQNTNTGSTSENNQDTSEEQDEHNPDNSNPENPNNSPNEDNLDNTDKTPEQSENKPQSDPEPESKENNGKQEEPLSDEEIESLLREIAELAEELSQEPSADPNNAPSKQQMADAAGKDNGLIAKECDGQLEIGNCADTILIHQEDNRTRYMESYERIKRYIPATAAALKQKNTTYAYNLNGMRSGILDMNKLAEARQGVQTVYTRKGKVVNDEINVVLIIDESGSMYGYKETLARDAAVLINEAIGKINNIYLSIYGYSEVRDRNVIFIYREGTPKDSRYSLGNTGAYGCTPTTEAIEESSLRVRKKTAKKTLMFVVSDGGADKGPESVKRIKDKIAAQGFDIVGISISSNLDEEELRMMYDNYITMNDISDLAPNLGKIVKKAIMQNTTRTTR